MDEAWHNSDLALSWGDYAGAVGSYQSGLRLCLEHVCDADHVVLGDAFSDANDEGDFGGHGFFNTGSC